MICDETEFSFLMLEVSIEMKNGEEAIKFLKDYVERIKKVNVRDINMAQKVFKLYTVSEFNAIYNIEDINMKKEMITDGMRQALKVYMNRLVR